MPRFVLMALILCLFSGPAFADDHEKAEATSTDYVRYPAEPVTTHHVAQIRGQAVPYTATAGVMPIVGDDGEVEARMFYIAYRRTRITHEQWERDRANHVSRTGSEDGFEPNTFDPKSRPITFSFNGGPGSSSVWLHLGIFGPRRVAYADNVGHPGPPPHFVVNNEASLLDQSDFVFIDPISTGFSRAEKDGNAKDFHGVEEDIASVAEFVRLYISREGRWASPKFIAGESYGTTRAAGLSLHLLEQHGIALNGVILVSSVMDFATLRFDIGNDLPYPLFVPTMAATAHYHKALGPQAQGRGLRDHVRAAERFAMDEYMPGLAKGSRLSEQETRQLAESLSSYIGIDADEIVRANLRVGMPMFAKSLLRDRRQTVGRLDSRFLGIDRNSAGDSYEYDASYAAIQANYTGSLNAFVRDELGFGSDLPYEILTNVWPWSFDPGGNNQYLNVAERLRGALSRQPHMRVFIASGYFDLATPHFATDYTIDQLQLDPSLADSIETKYYEAGHMMYIHGPSLTQLGDDLVGFYEKTPRREP